MTIVSTTPFVAALCLAGALAGAVLVRVLERRHERSLRSTLRAKFIDLFGAELSMPPALVVAAAGDALFGLRASRSTPTRRHRPRRRAKPAAGCRAR